MTALDRTDRVAGTALVIAAIGTVAAMGHHPTRIDSGVIGPVHGIMIALLILMSWGFLHFAFRQGVSRPLILGGLLAYGVGLFEHLGAATINGFAMPALASRGPIDRDILLFAWEVNQALARLGVYMTGVAFVLWSLDLLRGEGRAAKAVGGLGLLAGAAPLVLLGSGLIEMNVGGAFLAYALHAAWTAVLGAAILRGRLLRKHQPSGYSATSR